ncbi:MAG TPA: polysaccharide biosynthesis tyrosine autokinase [Candidatus Saccharimonadales bacterium]|nr:polysaccharide biosynthesis tyrosine autokinase [Candidatus Saccharimonadales bacterium]HUB86777.1 polysaccharide biosynthesis tyrosine autokinase [Verrucomicrobiae bacterium]
MDLTKNQPQPEAKLHFLDYWRIIRIRKAIIITVFLITAIIATAVTFILPPSYASTARIEIQQLPSGDLSVMGQGSFQGYDPYFLRTEDEIMQDQQVLSLVVSNLDLNDVWGKKYGNGQPFNTSDTIEYLKRKISLSPVPNTELVDITVYDDNAQEAADLANAVATAYRQYRLGLQNQTMAGAIKVLQDSYDAESQKILDMQAEVHELQTNEHVEVFDPNAPGPTPTMPVAELQQLNESLIEAQTRYTKDASQVEQLKKLDTDKLRDVLPGTVQDSELSSLLDKLHDARQRFVVLTNYDGPDNPDVKSLQASITEYNHEIDDRIDGIMTTLADNVTDEKASLDALQDKVEAAKQKDETEAERSAPYWDEKRELDNLMEVHNLRYAEIQEKKLELITPKTSDVIVVRDAQVNPSPVKPNKTLNIALGIIFGLLVGIGLAFFIEYLDTSVKTIDDVERALQTPVIGVIPQDVGCLLDEGPDSRHAEAYRVLRTNILFSRKDDKLNTIVVVSAGAGEGKSTTVTNLATVFAQAGDRVLIVDSDLRRPTLHKMLRVGNSLGLTNYLLKQNTLEEVIQTTSIPTLHLMASGKLPSSSMSILNSSQMKDMVTDLKRRYDFVFFDSPPILGVSDASVLASEMDMVIQVIQYRRYPQPMNIRAKQSIEKVGGKLAGICLNNINMSQDESYYYYSGYYHNYYYSRSEDEQEAAAKQTTEAGGNSTEIKPKY